MQFAKSIFKTVKTSPLPLSRSVLSTPALVFQTGVCCLHSTAYSCFRTVSHRLPTGSHYAIQLPPASPKKGLLSLPVIPWLQGKQFSSTPLYSN